MGRDRIEGALHTAGIELLGGEPVPIACPADVEQAQAVLRLAQEQGLRVVPAGLGSKLAWCRPEVAAGGSDLVLSTRRMDRVVEYVAGDGTLTAQAGANLESLRATVSGGGHHLTPDVPHGQDVTLGGVLGAGQSGIDRLRHGPLRHHVLGVTALLADGTVARSGGRLVKNVTGFDLHRLYTGARGSLCLMLEASLRLFPQPEQELAFALPFPSLAAALEHADSLRAANPPALALVVETRTEGALLHLLLAGRAGQLVAAEAVLQPLLQGAERLGPEAAPDRRERLRQAAAPAGSWPQLRLVAPLTDFTAALQAALRELSPDATPRLVAHPAVGIADLFLPAFEQSPAPPPELLAARAAARAAGGRLDPVQLPLAHHLGVATDATSPSQQWKDALLRQFDPEGRFASPSLPTTPTAGTRP